MSLSSILPSIRQQPNKTGEEHKQAYTSEGKSYPGGETDRQVTLNSTTENLNEQHFFSWLKVLNFFHKHNDTQDQLNNKQRNKQNETK